MANAELLEQAVTITDEIYKLTKAVTITGQAEQNEQEVEAFAALVEQRGPLVEKLASIKSRISPEDRETREFEHIRRTVRDISELEKNTHGIHGIHPGRGAGRIQKGKTGPASA